MRRHFAAWPGSRVVLAVTLIAFLGGVMLALIVPFPAPPSPDPRPSRPPAAAGPSTAGAPGRPPIVTAGASFIAPDGQDTNAGTIGSPWQTYAFAATRLRPGSTLYARGGTYRGQTATWPTSGTTAAPIAFRAYGDEVPVFDGGGTQAQFAFFRNGVHDVTVQGLTITGYHPVDSGVIDILEGANHITLDGLTMRANDGPTTNEHLIYIAAPEVHDVAIRNSRLDGIGGAGIHLFHPPNGRHITIDHNRIANCHWGIIVTSGADDVRIQHNTLLSNVIGIELADASNVQVLDNLSFSQDPGRYRGVGLWVDDPASVPGLVEDYNLWFRASGLPIRTNDGAYGLIDWQARTGLSRHSIEADPHLDDAGVPAPGSPAIGGASDGGTIGAG